MTEPIRPDLSQCCSFTTTARPRASHGTLAEVTAELNTAIAVLEQPEGGSSGLRCNGVVFANCLWDPTWHFTPAEAEPCPRPAEWLTTITGRARHCVDCENAQPTGCWDCEPLTVVFCDRCFNAMSDFGPDVSGWRI